MTSSICILGSTGSIGTQALDVARKHHIPVTALAAGTREETLERQAREFLPAAVYIDDSRYASLKTRLADTDIRVISGREGLTELAATDPSPTVVNALTGILGFLPTLSAVEAGKDIALANKETLVAGGDLVMSRAAEKGVKILPVDSEHSAIFQCLQCGGKAKKILLTGSGGPFFGKDRAFLETVTAADALRHPNWSMGPKITVDSSTLMNKGLEFIEAVHLFGVTPDQIEVVIQRESIIHSMVQFEDNAVLAQMGVPDMRLCIQYALTYPERTESPAGELDLFEVGKLTFYKPDTETFPLLQLAKDAITKGGNLPAAMNGANEEAVGRFLKGEISYTRLFDTVIAATAETVFLQNPTAEEILASDRAAREYVRAH
ncbi:MAG: 1-deoxy-D-xylulose-5-phosphate reductoisomerase [Clostridia bacterium]|jgi:1-deoxy-D-xylulose-5-phosphate reductoisomerase|nr:1-deoxy-D-xylulose-5-phosphate reductoisomerase [Clostridia bacterium]